MAISDIRREDVLGAIALLDDPVDGPEIRKQLHFGRALAYRLVHSGRFYDSKTVVGIAHGLGAGRKYLTSQDFSGGFESVVTLLKRRGFFVDSGVLHDISQLRVDRTHGRPAPYQYVVLLWAIARARAGLPRMVPFQDVRDELADILAPFAVAQTGPDPVMPWIALDGSLLWELEKPAGAQPVSESHVKSLNLAAGLSKSVYDRISDEDTWPERARKAFVAAAVDVVANLTGSEPGFLPLLQQLGLADLGSTTDVGRSPEVADAIAAVESVSNPRRMFGTRLTAAQKTAIEERAVQVTRDCLEDEFGYSTKDVGNTESYDVHATKGQEFVKVEVKGTTTDGAEVVLTSNEVDLHRAEHPNNALAVVRNITLDRSGDQPAATGGELVLSMPWEVDKGELTPIVYKYRTGF
ncbi:protein NO VEIN domain-containing protein [Mycobacterium spongiae]|uniref:DUF3883 domain-containing protein n=1 Tax=Mycobacterium spongiae TaxID=886343 RepID=A0A975PXV6_9MYCO|nr:DUF3883 domain-containing protein [Mycobacterium spongiae]QUR68158.1 DUF3883 domain-containing protein [Mycobacterium spongiae]